jgi:hypothetical protein
MGREVLVGPVDTRLVAARRRDPGLEIVADERLRHPAQEGQGIHMGADPVGQRLAEAGLGEGVVRCPKDRDEDLGGAHLPVSPSNTGTVSPAKSTNSFSPAAWVCRMVAVIPWRHST